MQQRLKQVGYGKNTIAYDNYRRQVPKNSRDGENPAHLRTPNARAAGISKRQFDGRLREWRSKLHVFWGDDDAESAAGASAGTEGARPAAADAGLVGSSAGFSLDDYLMGDEMDDALDGVGGQAGGDTARPEPQPLRPGAELASPRGRGGERAGACLSPAQRPRRSPRGAAAAPSPSLPAASQPAPGPRRSPRRSPRGIARAPSLQAEAALPAPGVGQSSSSTTATAVTTTTTTTTTTVTTTATAATAGVGTPLRGLGAQPPARGGGLSVRERLDAVKRKAAAAASATAEDIYGGWQEDDLLI